MSYVTRLAQTFVVCILCCQFSFALALVAQASPKTATLEGQQIVIQTRLVEINRSKLKRLGVDFASVDKNEEKLFTKIKATDSEASTFKYRDQNGKVLNFGIEAISSTTPPFFGFLDALCKNGIAKVLAEQTVAVTDGRTASLSSGGLVRLKDSKDKSEEQFVGTKLDVAPEILEDSKVRIAIDLQVSELSETASTRHAKKPVIDSRMVNTKFEAKLGETIAISGLRSKVRNGKSYDEVEAVLMVTPQLVGEECSDQQTVIRLGEAASSEKKRK